MSIPASPRPITKAALALGSAVAIAGLVSAAPAHAASNPCSGNKMGSKSSKKTDHAAMGAKKMKSGACGGACSGK